MRHCTKETLLERWRATVDEQKLVLRDVAQDRSSGLAPKTTAGLPAAWLLTSACFARPE